MTCISGPVSKAKRVAMTFRAPFRFDDCRREQTVLAAQADSCHSEPRFLGDIHCRSAADVADDDDRSLPRPSPDQTAEVS